MYTLPCEPLIEFESSSKDKIFILYSFTTKPTAFTIKAAWKPSVFEVFLVRVGMRKNTD